MKITGVSKKDEKNVVILLDDGEKLYLSFDVFMKNGLRKNDEISEDHFLLLVKENQKYYVKESAFRYLGRRPHSVRELTQKLRKKKYEDEIVGVVIDELIEKKYLDDKEFARMFVDEKMKLKLWGTIRLRSELIKRGVNGGIIDEVLNEKLPAGNDIEKAIILAEKKIKSLSYRNLPREKLVERVFSFLSSKGYDFDTCRSVTEKLIPRN